MFSLDAVTLSFTGSTAPVMFQSTAPWEAGRDTGERARLAFRNLSIHSLLESRLKRWTWSGWDCQNHFNPHLT